MKPRSDKPTLNLMVDIETVGTRPSSGILSIAAVSFSGTWDYEYFYEKCDKHSFEEYGFSSDIQTLEWWKRQSKEARDEAFSGTQSILRMMINFRDYVNALGDTHNVLVWGNGATFDNVLLATAFDICQLPKPWHYANDRCYRTLAALYPQVTKSPFVGERHNALADAQHQAAHATRIFTWMKER